MAQSIQIGWLLTTILAFSSAKSVQSGHGFGIWGGELANITELPHQVYIKTYGALYCGGSIISSRHILTERYYLSDPEDYTVVAATDDSTIGGEEYAVAEITRHPESEIAVVKLAKEIKFSDKAKPIALAGPKYRIKDGAELIASGWGRENNLLSKSVKLRKVTISKLSDGECKNAFEDTRIIDLSQGFCAGGEGKKTCLYDVGGPLIARTRKGNVLVGVTTYGPCYGSYKNKPSIFTKVSQFNKWIKEVVKQDLQNEADDIEVVLGTDNRTAGNGQVFQVANITVHENFTTRHAPFESLNNIAVLTLAGKIKISKKAKIIPLAKPKHQVNGRTELVASGWGMTAKPYGDDSQILKKVTVPKVDFDDCYRAHRNENRVVNENEICAGGQSGEGVFRGDSGGPLIEKTKKGNLQVGIAFWVHPYDDKPGFPDVYTQVSKYYNWIKKVLKKDLETETNLILPLEDEFDF